MRILQISHNNRIVGGSDAVFFATCDMLEEAGHEVIRFCIDHPENEPCDWEQYFPKGADTGNAPVGDVFRYFYNGDARRKLARLLDAIGPVDVAHLHIYHGKQTPAILPVLRKRGIPIVQTLHEYKLACPIYTMQRNGRPCEVCVTKNTLNAVRFRCKGGSRLRTAVMVAEMATSRLMGDVRLVDRFLCVSEFQRQIMARSGINERKLFTLHNFVKREPVSDAVTQGEYLLYFGRIEVLKGLPTLIEAATKTGLKLRIAGGGAWEPEMSKLIKDCPGIEHVGFQSGDSLRQLIAGARAVVVPSEWYENCPMSVLEAKALARPVIGAEIGGIPELVRDGVDGFLFQAGNVNSLIKALSRLENAEYDALSRRAVQDAEARFSQKYHLRQILGHYAELNPKVTSFEPALA